MDATKKGHVKGFPMARGDSWWGPSYDLFPEWVEDIVLQIPCELYFFGSRSKMYIDPANKESDWDFAIDYHHPNIAQIREVAHGLGFRSKLEQYPYQDGFTYDCWELTTPDGTIQLVFKVGYSRFQDVWDSIPAEWWRRFFHKKSPHYMGKEKVTETMSMFLSMHETATRVDLGRFE